MVETAAPCAASRSSAAVLGGGDHGDGNDRHGGLDDENASRKPGHIEKRAGQQDHAGGKDKAEEQHENGVPVEPEAPQADVVNDFAG